MNMFPYLFFLTVEIKFIHDIFRSYFLLSILVVLLFTSLYLIPQDFFLCLNRMNGRNCQTLATLKPYLLVIWYFFAFLAQKTQIMLFLLYFHILIVRFKGNETFF
ncbi:hypothetical protein EDEG_04007 [Edhazardia aedis USNM 41457]|uniref:Uncharacterized protein n=1 Tax=Edhazardia aedis (strain USNM 41457) TaxID=1003232 RepID=J9DFI8_EDHAE|nr:hypothetical protein EDEG_04007 [Edhazardia aedis USNM 41457]|eukprot:EJW01365.1 hypothetical protein EDEG_04007 [Edhazardia aedis USNM 41457]